jgi:hypothetical protein
VPVRVDATNIDGVVVATAKAANVSGRIVFEGGIPEQGTPKLSIITMPDELAGGGRMMLGPQGPATVRDDMSFELEGLFGPQLLSVVGTPRGWIVKSVTYRGNDVTDRAGTAGNPTQVRRDVYHRTGAGRRVHPCRGSWIVDDEVTRPVRKG